MPLDAGVLIELQKQYKVGENFTRTYLSTRYKPDFNREDLQEIRSKLPDSMWFEFAMSTNLRGEEFLRMIRPFLTETPRRSLDVGAGYGGFTVAYARAGMESVGVEINPYLAGLAGQNLSDFGITDCIILGDILDPVLLRQLGTFDLISCNDVIEHVSDAWQALDHMTGLLNPGGSLFLEIPNKEHVGFIGKDGHFSQFGMTLLPHDLAEVYHGAIYGDGYSVGEYYTLDEYISHLENTGCEVKLLPVTAFQSPRTLVSMYLRTLGEYRNFFVTQRRKLPRRVRSKVDWNYFQYMLKFAMDAFQALFFRPSRQEFKRRYAAAFWVIQARKK